MIKQNLARIRERIKKTAQNLNRALHDIKLICVTKNATIEQIQEATSCGITEIGENRVQDALLKYSRLKNLSKVLKWHMIGHLQTNKVKKAVEIFDAIHSLDNLKLAFEIDKKAQALNKKISCFIEVNTSGEVSKHGVRPEDTEDFVRKIISLPNINPIGLMTMAPVVKDPEKTRPYFIRLRQIKERLNLLRIPNVDIKELSMGMSQDFEVAIEEGATFLRIGTAIFGG